MKNCQSFISYLVWPSLAVRPIVIHTPGLTTGNGNISRPYTIMRHRSIPRLPQSGSSLSPCRSHIHTVAEPSTHWQSQELLAFLLTSLQSKIILALVAIGERNLQSRRPGQLVLQNVPQEWARDSIETDWPVVRRSHVFNRRITLNDLSHSTLVRGKART